MDGINLTVITIVANLILIVAGIIGGWMVIQSSLAHGAQEIQDRVKTSILEENDLLQKRLDRVEDENKLLKKQMQRAFELLEETRGIIIKIDGELIQIQDTQGSVVTTTRPTPHSLPAIKKRPARHHPQMPQKPKEDEKP